MSRTVRCKGFTPPERWLLSEVEWQEQRERQASNAVRRGWDPDIKSTFKATRKAELKRAHSDHGRKYFWSGTPPSHFVRDLNKKRRAIAKQELRESIIKDSGDNYIPMYPRRMKDASWLWD